MPCHASSCLRISASVAFLVEKCKKWSGLFSIGIWTFCLNCESTYIIIIIFFNYLHIWTFTIDDLIFVSIHNLCCRNG